MDHQKLQILQEVSDAASEVITANDKLKSLIKSYENYLLVHCPAEHDEVFKVVSTDLSVTSVGLKMFRIFLHIDADMELKRGGHDEQLK